MGIYFQRSEHKPKLRSVVNGKLPQLVVPDGKRNGGTNKGPPGTGVLTLIYRYDAVENYWNTIWSIVPWIHPVVPD